MSNENNHEARKHNGVTYDLSHQEITRICLALNQVVDPEPGSQLFDDDLWALAELWKMFQTNGTVSITVRPQDK